MLRPSLTRYESCGVTLLGDIHCPGGVTLAFTERTGGVSKPPYSSLNLNEESGDDPLAVQDNCIKVLTALNASEYADNLVCPHQVHGDHIVTITDNDSLTLRNVFQEVQKGADAVVCSAENVPVLLRFADCVPIIIVCEGAFAVVHSGWRGTFSRICEKATQVLCETVCTTAVACMAYIGPHIGVDDYEVSAELKDQFVEAFGPKVAQGTHLDLGYAVKATLVEAGIPSEKIASFDLSTASHTDRFYSYRAEGAQSGRHGACAILRVASN